MTQSGYQHHQPFNPMRPICRRKPFDLDSIEMIPARQQRIAGHPQRRDIGQGSILDETPQRRARILHMFLIEIVVFLEYQSMNLGQNLFFDNRDDFGGFQFDDILIQRRNDRLEMNHKERQRRSHVTDKIGGCHIHRMGGDILDQIGNYIRQLFFRMLADRR